MNSARRKQKGLAVEGRFSIGKYDDNSQKVTETWTSFTYPDKSKLPVTGSPLNEVTCQQR